MGEHLFIMRATIFIDGNNFYHGLKYMYKDSKKTKEFDFNKLINFLANKREIVNIFYYNAQLDKSENPKKFQSQKNFFEEIKKIPHFNLILCKLLKRKIKNTNKYYYVLKEDDIYMAVDIVEGACDNKFDIAILVSGDGDFVPAVKAVQRKNKKVENIYFKNSSSRNLKQHCNNSLNLTREILDKFFQTSNTSNLPITRQQALELLQKYNQNSTDFNHFLESEAIMKQLAIKLNKDQEYWAMLGLLHDIDWGITKNNPKNHLTKAPEILKKAGFNQEFIETIISHGYGFDCANLKKNQRTSEIQHALASSETLTGLIHAYALMRNKKISDMKLKGLKKKFKDKTFASGCNREIIKEIENLIPLDEFLELSIEALKNIKNHIGLE